MPQSLENQVRVVHRYFEVQFFHVYPLFGIELLDIDFVAHDLDVSR